MKKLIALSLLLPSLAFASVSIDSLDVSGNNVSASGSASYEGLQEQLQVMLDQVVIMSATLQTLWSVSTTAGTGDHTLTAQVSNPDGSNVVSTSQSFTIRTIDSGQPICMRTGECPYFGLRGGVTAGNFLASGDGECPIWFPFGCRK